MRLPRLALGFIACLAALPSRAQTTLILKSGEHYDLKGKAATRNGMVTFTTLDGRFLSVKQADIAEEVPTPNLGAAPLDGTDSRKLGEITRQTREERGVTAPVAPRKPPAPPKAEKKPSPAGKRSPKKHPPKSSPPSGKGTEKGAASSSGAAPS